MKLNNKHKKNPYNYKSTSPKHSTHGQLLSLLKDFPKDSVILDVGCNDGYLGQQYKDKYKFYGLDYLESSVKKASKIYEDAVVYDINNLQKLKWNKKFDVILFGDVLEHLIDGKTALDFFVKNYLKEEGKVIISLPNIANLGIRLKLLFGNFDYTNTGILDKTHLHLYTYKSAIQMTEASGLKVSGTYGGSSIFGYLFPLFPFLKTLLAHNIIIEAVKI